LLIVGFLYDISKPPRNEKPETFHKTMQVIKGVLPRAGDLDSLATYIIETDIYQFDEKQKEEARKQIEDVSWGETLVVSSLFIVAMLGISCLWFSTREY